MLDESEVLVQLRLAKEGNEKAKEILYVNNSPLIKSIVRRFYGKGIESEDLFQIGSLGFIKAINNFSEEFGVKFSTYAVPMIVGEIKRYSRDNGAIKVSRSVKILANKMNRRIDEYSSEYGRPPQVEELAKEFEISPEEVVFALDSARLPVSIYDRVDGDEEGMELGEKIADPDDEDDKLLKIQLYSELEKLPERERKIIYLRYFRAKTQSEIAKSLGISQVQVSRIENKILSKLRENFI
ncbi:MAG: SigB/SigF/SigG family RNA polymerase sigma factor [Clostridia bacterium]|nr:SigB/SigF/SigG family RNA polymerase sigma factor [Clostridia bacterium]